MGTAQQPRTGRTKTFAAVALASLLAGCLGEPQGEAGTARDTCSPWVLGCDDNPDAAFALERGWHQLSNHSVRAHQVAADGGDAVWHEADKSWNLLLRRATAKGDAGVVTSIPDPLPTGGLALAGDKVFRATQDGDEGTLWAIDLDTGDAQQMLRTFGYTVTPKQANEEFVMGLYKPHDPSVAQDAVAIVDQATGELELLHDQYFRQGDDDVGPMRAFALSKTHGFYAWDHVEPYLLEARLFAVNLSTTEKTIIMSSQEQSFRVMDAHDDLVVLRWDDQPGVWRWNGQDWSRVPIPEEHQVSKIRTYENWLVYTEMSQGATAMHAYNWDTHESVVLLEPEGAYGVTEFDVGDGFVIAALKPLWNPEVHQFQKEGLSQMFVKRLG